MKVIRPMLATLSTEIPTGPNWAFEETYDGIRALAYRTRKEVHVWSRNGLGLTAGFREVADRVAALPGGDLVPDGELVVFDKKGVSRFSCCSGAARVRGPRTSCSISSSATELRW